MANTSSAKKMVRKLERRTMVNKSRRSRVRTYLRRVEEAIATGDAQGASTAFREAQSELQRAVTRGIIHKNTASRKLSRLSGRIKSIAS